MNKVVEIENVSKKFRKTIALKNLNLTIESGEIHGFLGSNGAGKSTTLRILLGLIRADSGTTKVFQQNSWKNSPQIHKNISYLPGEVNLWPHLSGGEVIDIISKFHQQNNKKRRTELIEFFELDPYKKTETYSKGNKQKVALIAALAIDKKLLILDEPTSGLDPLMEAKFKQCLLEEKKQGKTILLSSHILSEVDSLCDTVSIIRKGEIIKSQTLKQMRQISKINLQVTFTTTPPDVSKIPEIFNIQIVGKTLKAKLENTDINKVLTQIAKHNITSLTFSEPNLEEIFLNHYTEN